MFLSARALVLGSMVIMAPRGRLDLMQATPVARLVPLMVVPVVLVERFTILGIIQGLVMERATALVEIKGEFLVGLMVMMALLGVLEPMQVKIMPRVLVLSSVRWVVLPLRFMIRGITCRVVMATAVFVEGLMCLLVARS